MTDGGEDFNLGHVVGADGDDGNGIASITKTGASGLVDTYTITYTDGTTSTFTVTNGSDASVTIQTSWGSTTSDSKVPSEKLTKDTLDNKASSTHTHGNLTNDGKVGSNANYFVVTGTSGAITSQQKIGNIDTSGKIGSTSGKPVITTTGGTVTTGSFGTSSGTFAEGNHTHSAYVNPTKVTSWSATVSDDNVASEKLIKDTLDTKQATLVSGTNIKTVNNESLLGSGNITIQGGSSVDIVTAWEQTLSDTKVPSEKLTKTTINKLGDIDTPTQYNTPIFGSDTEYGDDVTLWNILYCDLADGHKLYYYKNGNANDELATLNDIPTKTSDLTNDGDGTNVFVKNNDSRLTDSRTPTSHTHGNLTNDGKVGSTANYFVYTTTSGAITSKQKIGNITTSGAIGSTSGLPVITTTSGVLTTGSFGSTSGTFAEGNHTHSGYISTSSTTGLIKNDGTIMTSGTGSSNYAAGNHTHSGYLSATKVTSWSSTPSDSNVASEKLVKDTFDDIEDLIGDAITYINQ